MSFAIGGLSVDVVRLISKRLDAKDIAQLHLTGDRALHKVLATRGGLEAVDWAGPLAFPRFLQGYRLSSFSVSGPPLADCPQFYSRGLDVTLLARTLENLDLSVPNALAHIVASLDYCLANLFPNLKVLTFSPQFSPDFSHRYFCSSLPDSLIELTLPQNVPFSIESLLCLPCTPQALAVTLRNVKLGDESKFRNSHVASQLLRLRVKTASDVHAILLVPPSVTEFGWNTHQANLPSSALSAEVSAPPRVQDHGGEEANTLPKILLKLTLPNTVPFDYDLLSRLPHGLTYLEWQDAFADPRHERTDDERIHFLNLLPKTIEYLSTGAILISKKSKLMLLPPRLKSWKGLTLTFKGMQAQIDEMDAPSPSPPKSMTALTLVELRDADVFRLPDSLTSLETTSDTTVTWGLSTKSNKLKHLVLVFQTLDAREGFSCLPRTLEHAEIRAHRLTYSTVADWTRIWPKTLTHLKLEVLESMQEMSLVFWRVLPPNLTSLWVSARISKEFPKDLKVFPRTLTSCSITASRLHHNAPLPLLHDAFFSSPDSLPLGLTRLNLSGFRFACSYLALQKLPTNLLQLRLQGFADNSEEPLEDSFAFPPDWAAAAKWEFLNLLPRFLDFRILPHKKTPELVEKQQNRQHDDLIETCPNVTFGVWSAGSGRPNRTPSRGTQSTGAMCIIM